MGIIKGAWPRPVASRFSGQKKTYSLDDGNWNRGHSVDAWPPVNHPVRPAKKSFARKLGQIAFDTILALTVFAGVVRLGTQQPAPGEPTRNIGWSQNIKVMASSGQYAGSWGSFVKEGAFTYAIIDQLARPDINTLDEASAVLSKDGFSPRMLLPRLVGVTQKSTATPRQLGGWDKRITDRPRFVLLLGQQEFDDNVDRMESALQKAYHLPADRIKKIKNATPTQVYQGMGWLQEQIRQARAQGQKPEVLVYYSGHGTIHPSAHQWKEGDEVGNLNIGIDESTFKPYVNQVLQGAENAYMILESCGSGAWIG